MAPDTIPDPVAAYLSGVRERASSNAEFSDFQPRMPTGRPSAFRSAVSAADVPRLLAFAEAAFKWISEWREEAARLEALVRPEVNIEDAYDKSRTASMIRDLCNNLAEVITTALLGEDT